MIKKLSYHIFLTCTLVFVITINNAQEFSKNGISFGVNAGGSKLLGEIPRAISGLVNEFDNKTGFASALEVSKSLSPRLEMATEIGFSGLNGNSYSPEFSAVGFHQGTPSEINEPVEYLNKLSGAKIFFRYFFKFADSELPVIPFIKAGGGYINYYSKFKFIDAIEGDLIFGKGTENFTKLSTGVFVLGTGAKTTLSSNLYLLTSVDFNLVNYDFLDVVHNYSEDGNRAVMTGLYAEFKIGIFYHFSSSLNKKNKGTRNKGHLPFAR